jgi:hypothetical protein
MINFLKLNDILTSIIKVFRMSLNDNVNLPLDPKSGNFKPEALELE